LKHQNPTHLGASISNKSWSINIQLREGLQSKEDIQFVSNMVNILLFEWYQNLEEINQWRIYNTVKDFQVFI